MADFKSKFTGEEIDKRLDLFGVIPKQIIDAIIENGPEGEVVIDYALMDYFIKQAAAQILFIDFGGGGGGFLILSTTLNTWNEDNEMVSCKLIYSSLAAPDINGNINTNHLVFKFDMVKEIASVEYTFNRFKIAKE